ncbi:MAG: dihydrodipicolinate synthase family protein [Thermoflexales bacterium]
MSEHIDSPRYPRVILGAVCVPWDEHGEVLADIFREQIRLHLRAGIQHMYVFGTAGEGYAVSERQFDAIVDLFHAEMKGPAAHPMIGLISLSTRTIIERIERCLDRGLTVFQFALPGWGPLNDRELATFFAEVLGRFPQASFVHYNLQRAGRVLIPAEYARLAAEYPNLVGAKNGTSAIVMLRDLLVQAPMLRHFYTELGYPQGCQVGAPGYLMSLTTMNPALGVRFFEAGVRGDLATLFRIQAEALELFELLVGSGGAEIGAVFPGAKAHMDGAYEKALAKALDASMPLRLLPPYQAVTDGAYAEFVRRVGERLPEWLPETSSKSS